MNGQDKVIATETMWAATRETDTGIAGTALLAIAQIAGTLESDERLRLATTAFRLASDESCSELSRITAISICGRLGIRNALPLLLSLAETAPSIPLRISAIAALGDIGDATSKRFLQELTTGEDGRLRPAAESALRRLETSLQQGG